MKKEAGQLNNFETCLKLKSILLQDSILLVLMYQAPITGVWVLYFSSLFDLDRDQWFMSHSRLVKAKIAQAIFFKTNPKTFYVWRSI